MTDDQLEVTGRAEVGLRRVAGLEPAAPLPDSNPELVERIRAEIDGHGPLTFARFMELALYEPELGYYTRPDALEDARRTGGKARARVLAREHDEARRLLGVARRLGDESARADAHRDRDAGAVAHLRDDPDTRR